MQNRIKMDDNAEDSCGACQNLNCFIKKYFSPNLMEEFSRKKENISVYNQQQLFVEQAPASDIFFVRKGKLKIYKRFLEKGELILSVKAGGHMVGCIPTEENKYFYSASALIDSELCYIEGGYFNKIVHDDIVLARQFMQYSFKEMSGCADRLVRLMGMRVREKIADTILFLADHLREEGSPHTINTNMSRQELADISGTTKEQVSKILSEFQRENYIKMDNSSIHVLYPEKIEKIAGKR